MLRIRFERRVGRLDLGDYPEGEAASVAVLKALLQRHHLLEQRRVHRQRRDGREQPAVICGESQQGIGRESTHIAGLIYVSAQISSLTWSYVEPPSWITMIVVCFLNVVDTSRLTQSSLADVQTGRSFYNEVGRRAEFLEQRWAFTGGGRGQRKT